MKPNKARRDTQPVHTSTNTNTKAKSPESGSNEVRIGDNPLSGVNLIRTLYSVEVLKSELCAKHGLLDGGYRIMIKIAKHWMESGMAISAYALTDGNQGKATCVGYRLESLMKKGLITVIGYGRLNSRLYAPTAMALRDLGIKDSVGLDLAS